MKSNSFFRSLLAAIALIGLGILFRMVWHLGDNIEFVTTAAILAGHFLGVRWGIFVPLAIMVITDSLLGNSSIFLFTWSAYVIIGVMGYVGKKFQIPNSKFQRYSLNSLPILKSAGLGIGASVFFFLWTNFGVWMLDSWGMYPKTLMGLLQSYYFGIPFFQANLLGNLFFVPVSFMLIDFVRHQRWNTTTLKQKKAYL